MCIRIPGRDVMSAEAAERVEHFPRHLDARLIREFPEAREIVPPGPTPQAVEEGLHRELGGLFRGETGPVVEPGFGLKPRGCHRPICFITPPPELLFIDRDVVAHGAIMAGRPGRSRYFRGRGR